MEKILCSISKANFILNTRLEYIVKVRVVDDVLYIDMKSSTSSNINRRIKHFMLSGTGVAVFALRKDTSTNLLVLGTLERSDLTFVRSNIESRNGKFYRDFDQFRVRLRNAFNVNIKTSSEFVEKVRCGKHLGFVCPKMSFGKMPYVRGLISLLGETGANLAKNGNFNLRHSGCFVEIQ